MVDMTTKETIYDIPNIGCLLGMAYQSEVSRLSVALAEANLNVSPAEYLILRVVAAKGEQQQCDISRLLCKDKASVSRSVHSLAKKRLVNVTPVSYKCCMVALSDAGEKLMPELLKIAKHLQEAMSTKLSEGEVETLRRILETIIN